ncbi:RagB/SusD family nutrient uptake outer membrane protein [Parapedobacter tibetensis]|uniref:RagB/SusD family nutrient uptake outer membrane protein n=1 Tax=Parapedobacter tibetensis TaxID=2972951 RepID=UPI00214D34C1|nr:RagB/SusD family nutrient uptake outer membrane protein [Parapedobacter tibetensis]
MKKIILLIALTVFFSSCKDYFDNPRPQEIQWVNTTTFDQGLTSAYFNLFYKCLNGRTTFMEFASSGTSQLLPETSTGVPWNEAYNRLFNQNVSLNNDVWQYAYKTITTCNAAIALDESANANPFNLEMNSADYEDNYLRQIGEYHFLRAYAFYTLVRIFAAPYVHNGDNSQQYIPFTTQVPETKEDIYSIPLGTNAELYEQIVSDLRRAKAMLPEAFNASTMLPNYAIGRANQYAAAALLAKVLFVMGDYTAAEQELDFVIQAAENDARYALEEPIEAFNKLDRNVISREAILEFHSGIEGNYPYQGEYMYYAMIFSLNFRDATGGGRGLGNMVKSGWNQFTVSYWALDKMGWMTDPANDDYTLTAAAENDLRCKQLYYYLLGYKAGITDSDPDYLIYESVLAHKAVHTPQLYIDKYFRGGQGNELSRFTKFPLIRLGDLYLIRAWVRWNGGNTEGAVTDLNKIWNRANPTNPDYYTASTINHDVIFAEYLKEMAGEGWTLDFMMATQMDIPAGDRRNVAAVQPPYANWHWAIPVSETDLNPNY